MDKDILLDSLRSSILRECSPREILLYNCKADPRGEITSVKLCVVIRDGDPEALEHRLYIGIEADIPFDILVYTLEEWERLMKDDISFAARIRRMGRVLYAAD